jgi:hypothetical protein
VSWIQDREFVEWKTSLFIRIHAIRRGLLTPPALAERSFAAHASPVPVAGSDLLASCEKKRLLVAGVFAQAF